MLISLGHHCTILWAECTLSTLSHNYVGMRFRNVGYATIPSERSAYATANGSTGAGRVGETFLFRAQQVSSHAGPRV